MNAGGTPPSGAPPLVPAAGSAALRGSCAAASGPTVSACAPGRPPPSRLPSLVLRAGWSALPGWTTPRRRPGMGWTARLGGLPRRLGP
eukprot:185199-Alexandrium_andersonii.AAC.1